MTSTCYLILWKGYFKTNFGRGITGWNLLTHPPIEIGHDPPPIFEIGHDPHPPNWNTFTPSPLLLNSNPTPLPPFPKLLINLPPPEIENISPLLPKFNYINTFLKLNYLFLEHHMVRVKKEFGRELNMMCFADELEHDMIPGPGVTFFVKQSTPLIEAFRDLLLALGPQLQSL